MKYHEMIYVCEAQEYLNVIEKKQVCNLSADEIARVKKQVQDVYGDTEIVVSRHGIVFSNNRNQDVYTLGRIDRKLEFIPK